jgi:group I intron endonuclease
MGYIYKITNLISKKCYIGQTNNINPENRWKQHKYTCSKGGGCPALRDAIKKYGIDNFIFQVLIICFDEDRFIYEKEYIKKYNSIVPNGYNILEGGEGGGFKGKHHSDETKQIISNKVKKRFEDIKEREILKERTLKQMNDVKQNGINWGDKIKTSNKFKKALQEGRVGGKAHLGNNGHLSLKTKDKIRQSMIKYYHNQTNVRQICIEKHRDVMTKAKGTPVNQYTKEGIFIKSYPSIANATRENRMSRTSIIQCIDNPNKSAGGFIWLR